MRKRGLQALGRKSLGPVNSEGEKLLKLYIISHVLIGDFSAQKGIIRV